MAKRNNLYGSAIAVRANERNPRVNVPFCVAIVLLCLTLVSMHLTGGLFARYTAAAEFDDSARVAKFEIDSDFEEQWVVPVDKQVFEASPGEEKIYSATVTNNSEVAVRCTLSAVSETGNLPIPLKSGDSVVLSPGSTGNCSVAVSWDDSVDPQQYMGMVDLVSLELSVEQID